MKIELAEPFVAPDPIAGEEISGYIERCVRAFEEHVNTTRFEVSDD